jgi:hypothetical protein
MKKKADENPYLKQTTVVLEIDAGVQRLVSLINDLPGLRTIGSCEGHPGTKWSVTYVTFEINWNMGVVGLGTLAACLDKNFLAPPELSDMWSLSVGPGSWIGYRPGTTPLFTLSLPECEEKLVQIDILCDIIDAARYK